MLFFPLALTGVRAALATVPPAVEEVARSLGVRRWQVLLRVTLPLITPGLGVAAALVTLSASTELTATLLLRPIGTDTLATQFWTYTTGLAYGAAAPYAAVDDRDLDRARACSLAAPWRDPMNAPEPDTGLVLTRRPRRARHDHRCCAASTWRAEPSCWPASLARPAAARPRCCASIAGFHRPAPGR